MTNEQKNRDATTWEGEGKTFVEVIAAAKLGEDWALTFLYRSIHPALLRYLYAHARGDEEDLASEVWLEVARALARFEGDADGFRRFVFTVAHRRAIDHGRRRARRRTEPTDVVRLSDLADPADPETTVLDRMSGEQAVEHIRALLPADQAEIVLLRVVAGLSVAEVASLLGRPPAAISVVQHRALRRLARHLDSQPRRRR